MGHPLRFQLPLINETIEGVDAIVYDDGLFSDDGSPAPAIGASTPFGAALVLGPMATSGTPVSRRTFTFRADAARCVVEFEMHVEWDEVSAGDTGFLQLFGIKASDQADTSTTFLANINIAASPNGDITTQLTGATATPGVWSSRQYPDYANATIRVKIDYDRTGSGLCRTYVWDSGEWIQVNSQTITDGRDARKIQFTCRPLTGILTDGGGVTANYRKLAIALDGEDIDWSDLLASGQLRGAKHSATSGKVDQNFMVRYVPELYGTPIGTVHAEVQIDTDPDFGSPVYAVVECDSAEDYVAVISRLALDPLTTYHWRIRFTDGGTYTDETTAITGGSTLLTTDASSFETMSAPGGDPGLLRITFGNCTNHDDVRTPNGITPHDRILESIPHAYFQCDDQQYEDQMNGLATSSSESAGAVREASYMTRNEAAHWWHQPWANIASRCAIIGLEGNHIVDDNYPGVGATPTTQALVDDAFPGWDRYWRNGQFTTGTYQQDWITFDTARCRIFVANCHNYDNEAGTQGDDGRNLSASPPRMLGDTQQAALVDAVETCDKPIFLLFCSSPFASDAASPSASVTGWGLATEQRDAITDAADANATIKHFIACTGHIHWSFVTKQGLPKTKFLNIGCGPISQIASGAVTTAFLADYDGGPIWSDPINNGVETNDLIHRYCQLTIDEAAEKVTYTIKDGDGATLTSGAVPDGGPRGRNFRDRGFWLGR